MGSCLGRCLASKETKCHVIENNIYFNTESVEFDCLVDTTEVKLKSGDVALELDEDDLSRSDLRSKKQKVCQGNMKGSGIRALKTYPLNVYALEELQDVTSLSTPLSSIDLEWESEGLILPEVPLSMAVNEERGTLSGFVTPSVSGTPWSSPSGSLQWDHCEEGCEIYNEDTETEQLICEIEQLTSRALRETGNGWNLR